MKTSAFAIGVNLIFAASAAFAGDGSAPLADAAERGDRAVVGELLADGAAVDDAQADGMTALHWAVLHDDARLVAQLVKASADVNRANQYDVAPLSTACQRGSARVVELLLGAGANANAGQASGETALMTAARTGNIEPVNALLARGADVNAEEAGGQTALMWAAAEGNVDVVRALLAAGADVDARLRSGFTPLLFAVREGKGDVVFALIEAGADLAERARPRRSATGGLTRGITPLTLALENGHFELAAKLLDAGADPNDDRCGYAPLHALAWVRKVDSGDDDALPPPDGSGSLTSIELARRLVAHGADVNARLRRGDSGPGKLTRKGATPLFLAADRADAPYMRVLVELGADPSLTNADRATVLMAAAGLGTLAPGEEAGTEAEALEAVEFALELGGDVNAVDANGETAMHGAAYASWPLMVQWLADHGAVEAVWNTKNKHGWTPRWIAEGYRPGNFKPAPDTIAAIRRLMTNPDSVEDKPPKAFDPYAKP